MAKCGCLRVPFGPQRRKGVLVRRGCPWLSSDALDTTTRPVHDYEVLVPAVRTAPHVGLHGGTWKARVQPCVRNSSQKRKRTHRRQPAHRRAQRSPVALHTTRTVVRHTDPLLAMHSPLVRCAQNRRRNPCQPTRQPWHQHRLLRPHPSAAQYQTSLTACWVGLRCRHAATAGTSREACGSGGLQFPRCAQLWHGQLAPRVDCGARAGDSRSHQLKLIARLRALAVTARARRVVESGRNTDAV